MDYRVKNFDSASIQESIDAANAAGGGRVVLEPGVYHCSTIYMKSFVELFISRGAVLQGSNKPEDYDDVYSACYGSFAPENDKKALIAAIDCENIAITGGGEINGSGPEFYDQSKCEYGYFYAKPPRPRPRMIQFFGCKNVKFEDVSFVDSPGWTFWLRFCENIQITGIKVIGCQKMINNDGIDFDACKNATVSNSYFKTGDDCLVLRAVRNDLQPGAVCENIVVTNCVLDSACQGIKVGCPSDDTIRNCSFDNLVIRSRMNGINVNNSAGYLEKGDHGFLNLHDISFHNIKIDCEWVPLWIFVDKGVKLRYIGKFNFSNIRIKSAHPIRFDGCAETSIEDIRLNDIQGEIDHENLLVTQYVNGLKINNVDLIRKEWKNEEVS